jgi:glycerol-3-phosphate dehydrogenase subunit B
MDDPVDAIDRAHRAVFEAIGGYAPLDLSSPGVRVATERGVVLRAASTDDDILVLDGVPGGLVAVAVLRGHPSIDGGFVARGLSRDPGASDLSFVDVPVEYFGRRSDALVWPHEAAALGDAEDARARLGDVLERALPERRDHAWLLPPLLGVESSGLATALSNAVGRPVGELATSGAGAQGARLCRRLADARREAGIGERRDRAVRVEKGRVTLASDEVLSTDVVILASGSALAGGITPTARGDQLEEPLTATPVALGPWGDLGAPEEAFTSGVRFSDTFRLLGPEDETRDDGLFVCGGLLEGASAADGTGLGVAVTTGWLAGEAALAG